jgi:hypothetical protein
MIVIPLLALALVAPAAPAGAAPAPAKPALAPVAQGGATTAATCHPGTIRGRKVLAYLKARKNPQTVARKLSNCDKKSLVMVTGFQWHHGKVRTRTIVDPRSFPVTVSAQCGDPDFVGPCPYHKLECWTGYVFDELKTWVIRVGERWLRTAWCHNGVRISAVEIMDANARVTWPGSEVDSVEPKVGATRTEARTYAIYNLHWFGYKDVSIPINGCIETRGNDYSKTKETRVLYTCNTEAP